MDSGPLVASGGTQPAHLTPPPFSHSPKADPWKPRQDRIFSLFPLAGQASKRLAPQSEKRRVGSVSPPPFFFFFKIKKSVKTEKSLNLNHFCV